MSDGLEREFKLLLPGDDALRALAERLGGPRSAPVRQINHFFDTPARDLGRARIGLRVREERASATLTIKGPEQSAGGALSKRAEEELALDAATTRALVAGERSPLDVLRESALASRPLVARALALAGARAIERVGAFENERTRVGPLDFPPGAGGPALVFELDRTRFPGGRVEHELELELPPGADAGAVARALEELLARAGIPLSRAPSKAERFLRHLESAAKSGGGPRAAGG